MAHSELEHAKSIPQIVADQRAAAARIQSDRAAITPQDKSKRHGDSVSQGFAKWNELRSEKGGDAGLDAQLHAAALHQTENGKYELDVDKLAQEFGIPARSLYRRLEQPSMAKTAALMPKNRR